MTRGTLRFWTVGRVFVVFWISELVHFCPASQQVICTCESMDDPENISFMTRCSKRDDDKEVLSFLFTKHGYLDIKCKTGEPLNERYLEVQMLHKVTQLAFSSCNVPNHTLNNILQRAPVSSLTIKNRNSIKFLGNMIPLKLPSLREFILSGNGIEGVSQDAFRMTTGLNDLDLSNNCVGTLPPGLFSHISNLTSLNLEDNYLSFIPTSIFRGLFQLEKLLLSRNRLKTIPGGAFYDLKSLQILNLDKNELTTIAEDMLSNNSELQYLDISQNFLKQLPKGMIRATTKLETFNITNNELSWLPMDLLLAKESLQNFELNHCSLKSLTPHFFDGAPNLLRLSMRNNQLTVLKDYLFTATKLLNYLDLSYNKLADLISSPFYENKELKILKINNNNLRNVSKHDFWGLVSLTNLDISSNFIENIEAESFRDLKNVIVINVSNNAIFSIQGSLPFGPSEKLEVVDISRNNLLFLPDGWEAYKSLKDLIAWNNSIVSLSLPVTIARKSTVHLQNNNIVYVNISLLNQAYKNSNQTPSEDVPMYLMENNPFRCDCHLYEFYKYFSAAYPTTPPARFYDGHKLTCGSPWNLKGITVVTLHQQAFTCNITKNCPEPCFCSFQQSDGVVTVNCKGKQLHAIPNMAPQNVSILRMENNNLNSLAGIEDPRWENLTKIYLDDNFIQSEEWQLPRKLQFFSLTKNQLTWLPDSIKYHANKVKLFKMKLGGNPWKCNCWLKTWMSQHFKEVLDAAEVFCLSGNDSNMVTSYPLMNTTDSILCPADTRPFTLRLNLYVTSCVIVAVIIIAIVALYYRNKRTVVAYIYTHFQWVFQCFFRSDDFDDDKVFDAFVSYSSDDRDVTLQLIEEMETKPPHYKLCIHERDWVPGNLIADNIVHSVQNSKRTILVISEHFLESIWFHVEFHVAYYQMLQDKTDRIIVIVKGELPPTDSFDKELKHLLSTKTYLLWGEKWFWEKLRYSMPYRRRECTLYCSSRKRREAVAVHKQDTSLTILNDLELSPGNQTDLEIIN